MGWYHATPEGAKKSRIAALKVGQDKTSNNDNAPVLELPELEGCEYMVHLFYEAGMSNKTGMSVTPLSWLEIDAWKRLTQRELDLWEILTIMSMSEAYVNEYHSATDKSRSAPYIKIGGETHRKNVTSQIKNIFAKLLDKSKDNEVIIEERE